MEIHENTDVKPDGPTVTFFRHLSNGDFMIQQCDECNTAQYFPRILCLSCGSSELNWIKPSGQARVYATTTVRRADEAGGDYNVSLVDLEEGPRMMTTVRTQLEHSIEVGMAVTFAGILDSEDGVYFMPQDF